MSYSNYRYSGSLRAALDWWALRKYPLTSSTLGGVFLYLALVQVFIAVIFWPALFGGWAEFLWYTIPASFAIFGIGEWYAEFKKDVIKPIRDKDNAIDKFYRTGFIDDVLWRTCPKKIPEMIRKYNELHPEAPLEELK